MQSSKWAPKSPESDPFAKLQAAFHTRLNARPVTARLNYPVEEFAPNAGLAEPLPVTHTANEAAAESPHGAENSSVDRIKPAYETTSPSTRYNVETNPDSPMSGTEPAFFGTFENALRSPKPYGLHQPTSATSRLAPHFPSAGDKSDVATSLAAPAHETDRDLVDLEEWEAEERREAERQIAEKKRLFLEKRKLQQPSTASLHATDKKENNRPEETVRTSPIAAVRISQPRTDNRSEAGEAKAVAVARSSIAPSILGIPQSSMLAILTPSPRSMSRQASPEAERISREEHLREESNKLQRMAEDREAHDKERAVKHAQLREGMKAAFVTQPTSPISNRAQQRDERLMSPILPVAPTPVFKFSFTAGAKSSSTSAVFDKLHTRPADKMKEAETAHSNPVDNGRQASDRNTQDNGTSEARVKNLSGTDQSLPLVEAMDNLTIGSQTSPPHLRQKRPAKSAEDEFIKLAQSPNKRPVPAQRSNDVSNPNAKATSAVANALPVDKLAFTLRSSSRESDSHPSNTVTPSRDTLATAHAAMNQIDRTNVKTQGEFIFTAWPKPQDRPASFIRRVHISGLPTSFTATQVLSLVWGGRIERLDYKSGTGHATVLFMAHEGCEKYYNATCNGVDIPGQSERFAVVKFADRTEAAHEFLRGLIAVNATRCIRVIGVDTALGMSALTKLAMGGKREVERIVNGVNSKGLRTVEFRFLNVYDAMRFKSELEKLEDWERCNIFCAPDPCAEATGVHTGVSV